MCYFPSEHYQLQSLANSIQRFRNHEAIVNTYFESQLLLSSGSSPFKSFVVGPEDVKGKDTKLGTNTNVTTPLVRKR